MVTGVVDPCRGIPVGTQVEITQLSRFSGIQVGERGRVVVDEQHGFLPVKVAFKDGVRAWFGYNQFKVVENE